MTDQSYVALNEASRAGLVGRLMDRCLAEVSHKVVQQILAVRPRTLIRAIHRGEHMDEIEAALQV